MWISEIQQFYVPQEKLLTVISVQCIPSAINRLKTPCFKKAPKGPSMVA